jgi:cystathionine beta-lyase/cystathionine gamma-synthase
MLYHGLQTLKIRVKQQQYNGLKVAQYLESHPKIEKVIYPELESYPYKSLY